jgi:hypothetical protein
MRKVQPTRDPRIDFTTMFTPPEPDDWLLDAMDEAIAAGQTKWNPPSDYFRASSAGQQCYRAAGFRALGHGTIFDARILRIFRMGNAVEAGVLKDLQGAMRSKKVFVRATQAKVNITNPPMRGTLDVLILKTEDGEELVGEIKSMNKGRFDKLPKPSGNVGANVVGLLNAPHTRDNVCQLMIYIDGGGWTKGFLLYECKDDSRRRLFWLERDQRVLDDIFAVHGQAYLSVQKQMLPPVPLERRPNNPSDKVCRDCSAQYLCTRLSDAEVGYTELRAMDKELRGG